MGCKSSLRPQSHAAFQRDGLAAHELEVGAGKLHHDATDLGLHIAVVAHGGHVHVGREGVGISFLEVLQSGRPGQRAHHVHVDAIGAPLGGGHARESADALLGGGVGALAEVAEEACTGGEVDDRALGLL